jgi:broad specificity phosphatase PhoE
LNCEIRPDEDLRGLNLGVLAGLSRADAARRAPKAAQRLESWRKGQLRVDHLELPGAEALTSFERRSRRALNSARRASPHIPLLVVTRSTFIMLHYLMAQGASFSYAGYHAFEVGNGEMRYYKWIGGDPSSGASFTTYACE